MRGPDPMEQIKSGWALAMCLVEQQAKATKASRRRRRVRNLHLNLNKKLAKQPKENTTPAKNMSSKEKIQSKINEFRVLENELSTMKRGHRVYQQQQNSNVFFLAETAKCKMDCEVTLGKLTADLKSKDNR
ncbi:ASNSD1 upstream open reading frame protein-like [Asterias amurensis]|uniref:ASNSD1 upstream open reading frame protein-like n=1 Tax=Asterias amurensis TaxID=7602 RepID=UPI003AB65323